MKYLLYLSMCIYSFLIYTTGFSNSNIQFTTFSINPAILNSSYTLDNQNNNKKRRKFFQENSTIFDKIKEKLNQFYLDTANDITDDLINYKENFILGDSNYSGFEWKTSINDFGIHVGRKIIKDTVVKGRWIVNDVFTLTIGAQSYLQQLKEKGVINISSANLGLFAGINFKRKYTYTHYAESYLKGLISDYTKLFLTFTKLSNSNILKIKNSESVSKEDYISSKISSSISTVPVYFTSLKGGVSIGYTRISKLVVHSPGENDFPNPGEKLRISLRKEKIKSLGSNIDAQIDFYNLLSITLFSYQQVHAKSKIKKLFLSFNHNDLNKFINNKKLNLEVRKLISLKMPEDLGTLKQYVSLNENEIKEIVRKKALSFLGENTSSTSSQKFEIKRPEHKQLFFLKNNYQTSKITKGIINNLIYKKNPSKFINKKVTNISFEYKLDEEQKDIPIKDMLLSSSNDFQAILTKSYELKKTKGLFGKIKRKRINAFIGNYSILPSQIVVAINNNILKGPIAITTNMQIGAKSVAHLNSIGLNDSLRAATLACSNNDNKLSRAEKKCIKKLDRDYKSYYNFYASKDYISVQRLERFIKQVSKRTNNIFAWQIYFGNEYVSINGVFEAKTKDGKNYTTYFSNDQLSILGPFSEYLHP